MHKMNLIAGQVLRKNLRGFSWWLMVLMPLLAVAVVAGIVWYMTSTSQAARVVVVAPQPVAAALKQQRSSTQEYVPVKSEAAGRRQLSDEEADGMLVVKSTASAKLYRRDDGQSISTGEITQALAGLNTAAVAQSLGLSQAQLGRLLAAPKLATRSVAFTDSGKMTSTAGKSDAMKQGLSTAVGFLMYMFLMSYGSIIAAEIATEKGSRIEESILVAIRPQTQFYGKILGVSALLGLQVGIYAILAGAVWLLRDTIPLVKDLLASIDFSQIGWAFVLISVIFFLVGILSYTVLAAMCGSLVANQEQAGQALQPVILLAMVGYFASLMTANANGSVIGILSYVPFLSPMIMPARFGIGQAALGPALISLAISIIFLGAFTVLAERIYAGNVLTYSEGGIFKALRKSLTLLRAK
ncbi:ABC transporter permease [Lacticaseibacillus hegangensis]|uniref:ABC transporter permease n=1 Tax=Lacticaseibacillus hegangensis TaxID=2486010 RepID=A0ABW4CV52_9LACO|nr:ABC transporter permease [Lacticaseibacillus hegangensis]